MTTVKKNYLNFKRKALAESFGLKMFRVYLFSSIPFSSTTDSQALNYFFKRKEVHGRLARWLYILAEFDLKIEYRSGQENIVAHYLSHTEHAEELKESLL